MIPHSKKFYSGSSHNPIKRIRRRSTTKPIGESKENYFSWDNDWGNFEKLSWKDSVPSGELQNFELKNKEPVTAIGSRPEFVLESPGLTNTIDASWAGNIQIRPSGGDVLEAGGKLILMRSPVFTFPVWALPTVERYVDEYESSPERTF